MSSLIVGLFCLVVPGVALAAVVVLLVRSRQRDRLAREQGMAGFAAQREWGFSAWAPTLAGRFRGDPFGRGSHRSAANAVEGRYEGRPFVAFDYSYVTTTNDSTTTHRFSVVAMHLGSNLTAVQQLQVSPQSSLGRFFSGLFGTDLVIGRPAFDAAFHVRTTSPQLAHDVLHPAMTDLLAGYQDRAWRLQDDSLLMFRSGSHSPQEIDRVLWSMKAILDQVPAFVWAGLDQPRRPGSDGLER